MAARSDLIPIDDSPDVDAPEYTLDETPAMEVLFENESILGESDILPDQTVNPNDHHINLVEVYKQGEDGEVILKDIASEVMELYDADKESRSDWEGISADAVELLGFAITKKDKPFPGACGASHPVLSQAVVKFQAKAYKELFPAHGPVRTRIMGTASPEAQARSNRVKEFMNYQTTKLMPEYGPQLDKLLFHCALFGSAFKKTYYDAALQRPTSRLVKSEDFVIDYYADDLETAERYTHKMTMTDNEIKRYQMAGVYSEIELSSSEAPDLDETEELVDEMQGRSRPTQENDPRVILEIHINIDLPLFEDPSGLALPYVITIDEDSEQILSIRRNWKEADPNKSKIVWFTHYCFVPGLGFYGYGYLHLIGGLAKTATSSLQQLVDAGTFSNLPAGFKAHGLRMLAPDEPLLPGEWREANAPAGDLNKSLIPLPYKEPSSTLYQLMTFMVQTAKEFADQTDAVVSESSNYGPVGTTLALLEQSGKLFSAIHQRLHAAQGHDLNLLAELNFQYLPNSYPYPIEGGQQEVFKQDFDPNTIDIIPVSDPNMPTEAHRVAKLNAIISVAAQDPGAHDMNAIRLDLYRAMGVESPERYLKQQQQPQSGDPVFENSIAMVGQPLTVQPHQNDDAHILVHSMILNNQAFKDNQGMRQIMTAHLNEHMAAKHRKEMVEMIAQHDPKAAQALMAGQQKIPPEIENAIALAAMQASDAVLKLDEVKLKAYEGEMIDPEQALRDKELDLRERKQQLDYTIDQAQLLLDEEQMQIDDSNEDADRSAKVMLETMKINANKEKARNTNRG